MIVSVSRRCDIPRFRFDWFLDRLKQGFTETANPFNAAQGRRVSLLPCDVDCLVFWTRDPRPLLAAQSALAPFPFYVMTTLTGYPEVLEPNSPAKDEVIRAMRALADRYGPDRVIWRYDPVLLSSATDRAFHVHNFADIAARLTGAVSRVIVSVYDEYSGARRRLAALEKSRGLVVAPHYTETGSLLPEVGALIGELAAASCGIELRSCAENGLESFGVKAGACIDGERIRAIIAAGRSGETGGKAAVDVCRDKNQRPQCLCCASVDIGAYGTCPAGCVYCYARR